MEWRGWRDDIQPVYSSVVGEFIDKLINDSVDSNSPTGQFKFRVDRIEKDKVIAIEVC